MKKINLFKNKEKKTKVIKPIKVGLRTIKTVTAVFLCTLLSFFLKTENPLFSSTAAIICMQPTANKSITAGKNRFFGTCVGGLLGFALLKLSEVIPFYYEGLYIICIPLIALVSIIIFNYVNMNESIVIGCIVFLSLVANPIGGVVHIEEFVMNRIMDTTIGIVISVGVNMLLPTSEKTKMININKE